LGGLITSAGEDVGGGHPAVAAIANIGAVLRLSYCSLCRLTRDSMRIDVRTIGLEAHAPISLTVQPELMGATADARASGWRCESATVNTGLITAVRM
jgi:hypothetical protein